MRITWCQFYQWGDQQTRRFVSYLDTSEIGQMTSCHIIWTLVILLPARTQRFDLMTSVEKMCKIGFWVNSWPQVARSCRHFKTIQCDVWKHLWITHKKSFNSQNPRGWEIKFNQNYFATVKSDASTHLYLVFNTFLIWLNTLEI